MNIWFQMVLHVIGVITMNRSQCLIRCLFEHSEIVLELSTKHSCVFTKMIKFDQFPNTAIKICHSMHENCLVAVRLKFVFFYGKDGKVCIFLEYRS